MGNSDFDLIALSELDGKLYPCPITLHVPNTYIYMYSIPIISSAASFLWLRAT